MERGVAGAREALTLAAGNGIELRPVCVNHAEGLYRLIDRNRARLRKWLPWIEGPYGPEDSTAFILERERDNSGRMGLTSVIFTDDEMCGAISLHTIDRRNWSTSIGYWLDAAFEGRGIMTGACRAMVTAGFRDYGLHRIEIRCATENEKSGAIPERLGFKEEGILREAQRVADRWLDLRVFSMLERDWDPVSGGSGALR